MPHISQPFVRSFVRSVRFIPIIIIRFPICNRLTERAANGAQVLMCRHRSPFIALCPLFQFLMWNVSREHFAHRASDEYATQSGITETDRNERNAMEIHAKPYSIVKTTKKETKKNCNFIKWRQTYSLLTYNFQFWNNVRADCGLRNARVGILPWNYHLCNIASTVFVYTLHNAPIINKQWRTRDFVGRRIHCATRENGYMHSPELSSCRSYVWAIQILLFLCM